MKLTILSLLAFVSLMSFKGTEHFNIPKWNDDRKATVQIDNYGSSIKDGITPALPAFDWTETSFDFGKIEHNKPVTHEFRFVNKGAEALIITSVQASCGCTVARYSKDPVAPGSEGFVIATFNAATKGTFNKTVTVNANTEDGLVVLSIRGQVE